MPRYIDANKLISALKARYDDLVAEYAIWDNYTQGFCEALDTVEDISNETASTADVQEVKHGKWIFYSDLCEKKCTICGKFAREITDYCPHCGAEMIGEKNYEGEQK